LDIRGAPLKEDARARTVAGAAEDARRCVVVVVVVVVALAAVFRETAARAPTARGAPAMDVEVIVNILARVMCVREGPGRSLRESRSAVPRTRWHRRRAGLVATVDEREKREVDQVRNPHNLTQNAFRPDSD
jgi:hypothetical protein